MGAALARVERLRRRLDPKGAKVMGKRNRDRLEQFDEAENMARLLGFPRAEEARALRLRGTRLRASGMERALAAALLIDTCLRLGNLRRIRLADLRRAGGATHLTVEGARVKNGAALAFELGEDTAALLERFVEEHRPHLPGHEGPYLFPGRSGGAKSDTAMRQAISGALRKRCGLTMSPHLFRHVVAKLLVEKDPAMYGAVSRHLGHRSMGTTMAFYLGAETRAASRKLGQVLRDDLDDLDDGED
jgi:integrase